MIFLWNTRFEAIRELIDAYPELQIEEETEEAVVLEGEITVNRKTADFNLFKKYKIRVQLFKDEQKLPEVYDIANQVDEDYVHRYKNGMFCLDTDTTIKLRYENGIDLCSWMFDFVEMYFFSYEYYKRNGSYPFGERGHGSDGIIETYGEYFHVVGGENILKCMEYIAFCGYRGHDNCPCGSGKYIRKCHGKYMVSFCNSEKRRQIVKADYEQIKKEMIYNKYAT